ncbi:hypothetical protein CVT91_12075 [Candidatus Atribacteria bacterium HGW-Atribacteria-1]|nr:MAG: hypothetical protein CVT91_12075 [Candidatus Atribacteria bacterium HGW-Atribacteria-1]
MDKSLNKIKPMLNPKVKWRYDNNVVLLVFKEKDKPMGLYELNNEVGYLFELCTGNNSYLDIKKKFEHKYSGKSELLDSLDSLVEQFYRMGILTKE